VDPDDPGTVQAKLGAIRLPRGELSALAGDPVAVCPQHPVDLRPGGTARHDQLRRRIGPDRDSQALSAWRLAHANVRRLGAPHQDRITPGAAADETRTEISPRLRRRSSEAAINNPLKSEAEAFRLVVIFGIAGASIIALTLLTRPLVGAIWSLILLGAGIGYVYQASRGRLPAQLARARLGDDRYRLLVVGNETVGGKALLAEIRSRSEGRDSEVLVLTPAVETSPADHRTSDGDEQTELARQHMEISVQLIQEAGLRASGEIGESDPLVAIEAALRAFPADEILISTLPVGRSRWLEDELVAKARERNDLPVHHLIVDLDTQTS